MRLVAITNEFEEEKKENLKIDFLNSVGLIIENQLFLSHLGVNRVVEIETIKSFKLVKQKKVFWNSICFILGASLFSIYFIKQVTLIEGLLQAFFSVLFFISSYFINISEYILILSQKNLNFIEIEINKALKNDAKKLIHRVEKAIRKLNNMNSNSSIK